MHVHLPLFPRSTWLLAIAALLLLPATGSAQHVLELGQKAEGSVGAGDTAVLEVTGIAGELLSVSVSPGKKSTLVPRFDLVDVANDAVVASSTPAGKGAKLTNVVLPVSGLYHIVISGASNTAGSWKAVTKGVHGKELTKPAASQVAGKPSSVRVEFDALAGTQLDATVKPAKGSAALPGDVTLTGPDGVIDLGAALSATGSSSKVKKFVLPSFGSYVLEVLNAGDEGELSLATKLKVPKPAKIILVTDAFSGDLLLTPDVLFSGEGATEITATIALVRPLSKGEVVVLQRSIGNGTPVQVSQLFDDGELGGHGDEIDNDLVHTARLQETPTEDDLGLTDYQAVLDLKGPRIARSPTFSVLVAEPLTNQQVTDILGKQAGFEALLDQAVIDDTVEATLASIENTLANDPDVLEFGRSDGQLGLWIVYAGGIPAVLYSPVDDVKGGGAGRSAAPAQLMAAGGDGRLVPYAPYSAFRQRRGAAPAGGQPTTPAGKPGAGGSIALGTPPDNPVGSNKVFAIAAQFFDWGNSDDIPSMQQTLVDNGCFDVTYKTYASKGSGSVEDFKNLGNYGIVLISSHGDSFFADVSKPWKATFKWADTSTGQVCLHSNMAVNVNTVQTYRADLLKGRLILWYGNFGITPSFIRHYTGNMPNSLVYMSICRGTFNSTMADAFIAQGAAAYLGYSDYVAVSFCQSHGPPLLDTLLLERMTLDDAYTFDVETDADPAAFLLFGATDLAIDPASLKDGSFESGNIAGAWSTAGDARVVGGLGGYGPTDGNLTAIISTGLGFTVSSGSFSQELCLPADTTGIFFDWNFFSAEFLWWCGFEFQDTFEVELTDVANPFNTVTAFRVAIDDLCGSVSLTDILFDKQPGTPPFEDGKEAGDVYATGWTTQLIDVPPEMVGKKVRITFRCFDVGDSEWDTAVLVDAIEVVRDAS